MEYCSRIDLVENGSVFFDKEAMELLKLIDTEKSIDDAAKTLKISTAKAKRIIKAIEKALGEKAVIKTRNAGVDGYNVHISPACRGLLEKYAEFTKKSEEAIKKVFNQIF